MLNTIKRTNVYILFIKWSNILSAGNGLTVHCSAKVTQSQRMLAWYSYNSVDNRYTYVGENTKSFTLNLVVIDYR